MKETRDRIVQQALAYFSQHDYERTSLNDIAGALGVTKGAIYHYFGSKDELFKEAVLFVLESMGELFGEKTEEDNDLPFKEKLSLWFNFGGMLLETTETVGMDFTSDYASNIYLMFAALKKFPEVGLAMNNLYEGLIEALTYMMEKARDKKEIRDDLDLPALAFELTAFIEGSMLMGSVLTNMDLADLGPRVFDNFWLRIKPEEV